MNPPPEPKTLDTIGSWRDLIVIGQHAAMAGNMGEARRVMTRLFTEAALADCARLIESATEQYLETAKPARADELRAAIKAVCARVVADDFPGAHALFKPAMNGVALEPGASLRLALMALGVMGAASRRP